MDEVPIPNANPVKIETGTTAKPPAKKPAGTFKNFFLMMPLAIIVLVQGFAFGRALGEYTVFPLFTIQSYLILGALLVMTLIVQIFMRSIIYSTVFGFLLLCGIFQAWFGDFWTPVLENFKEVLAIMKSAWSKKDIPYPILMVTIMVVSTGVVTFLNFFLSLVVKYFFEIVFGTDWSDGRKAGFASAIVFLLLLHGGFSLYSGKLGNPAAAWWSQRDVYKPVEEFIARIPSACQFSDFYVWNYDPRGMTGFDSQKGNLIRNKEIAAKLLTPTFTPTDLPFVPGKDGITCLDKDLLTEIWKCPYPEKLPDFQVPPEDDGTDIGVPILLRTDVSPNYILALFDYGFWGAILRQSGKIAWIKSVDFPTKLNRYFAEEFIRSEYVVGLKATIPQKASGTAKTEAVEGEVLVVSCNNAKLVALDCATGEQLWTYNHPETKFGGKGQRALLSAHEGKIVAAYPSGYLVVFDPVKGTRLQETSGVGSGGGAGFVEKSLGEALGKKSEGSGETGWHPITGAVLEKGVARFVTSEGNFVKVEIDGGKILAREKIIESRIPLMPYGLNVQEGFFANRDKLFHWVEKKNEMQVVMTFPRHVFATNPVFEGELGFVGTQDGWVICFHKDSHDEKYRFFTGGELCEDSLAVFRQGVLVRTRSGSLFCLKKTWD